MATLQPDTDPMADNQSSEIQGVDELLDSSLESVDAAELAVVKVAEEAGFDEDDQHGLEAIARIYLDALA